MNSYICLYYINLKQFFGLTQLVEITNPLTNYTKKVAKEHSVRILNLLSCRTKVFSSTWDISYLSIKEFLTVKNVIVTFFHL